MHGSLILVFFILFEFFFFKQSLVGVFCIKLNFDTKIVGDVTKEENVYNE